MRAGMSPFSGMQATWTSVPGFVSDYIVEETPTGSRVRIVEGLIDSGFFRGGTFHDQEADLTRSETEEAVALLLSKMLHRNLEGLSDIWVLPHQQLERSRARSTAMASHWEPTSVLELSSQVQQLTPETVVLQTLRGFSLLDSLATPFRVPCRIYRGSVELELRTDHCVFPSGLVYGVISPEAANRVVNKLVEQHLLEVTENSLGKHDLVLSPEGAAIVEHDAPLEFEMKSFVREIEESKQHPLPDLTVVTKDTELAAVLSSRWQEADVCHRAGSYFAAMVVIGSILEGCLLARARHAIRYGHNFRETPVGKETDNPEEWGLANLLAVSANEGWIKQDRHRLGHVLRESRNLVHPANIESTDGEIDERSARTYWEILQGVVEDLTDSYK
jgi:(2Fe-2S) ferredoxin